MFDADSGIANSGMGNSRMADSGTERGVVGADQAGQTAAADGRRCGGVYETTSWPFMPAA